MKLLKTSNTNGKTQVKLSKSEWKSIGKEAGWLKTKISSVGYEEQVLYTIDASGLNLKLDNPYFHNYYKEMLGELDLIVDITITKVGNDGIGSYEFWGSRGNDEGIDYIEDFEINSVRLDVPRGSEQSPILSAENEARIKEALYSSNGFKERVQSGISLSEIQEGAKEDALLNRYEMDRDTRD